MHSQSDPNKTHYYFVIDDTTGGVMSGCGHLSGTMFELRSMSEMDPLSTTCAGCLRSRHYKRAIKEMESMMASTQWKEV